MRTATITLAPFEIARKATIIEDAGLKIEGVIGTGEADIHLLVSDWLNTILPSECDEPGFRTKAIPTIETIVYGTQQLSRITGWQVIR